MRNKYSGAVHVMLIAIFMATFISCQKNSVTPPVVVDPVVVLTDSSIYIDFTIGSTRTLGVQNVSAGSTWGSYWPGALGPTGDSSIYHHNRIGAIFTKTALLSQSAFIFTKGNAATLEGLVGTALPTPGFINSFFTVGNYTYASKGNDTTVIDANNKSTKLHLLTDGITLAWNDAAGTLWTSFNGSADQAGSYFTITKVEYPFGPTWANLAMITANFDCKLYDGNGNSIHLINGKFRQPIY